MLRLPHVLAQRIWHDESGSILVWLVLIVPVAIVVAAFVVNVANWFEHRRHLQMQVDSGALAAGGNWVFTFKSGGVSTCSDSDIENEGLQYAGDQNRLPSTFNTQVSNQAKVHVLFNSPSYWVDSGSSSLENTQDGGGPCKNGYVDVKATDDQPPLIIGNIFSSLTPSIHAHARVDFFVADTISGGQLLPVALPDPTPKKAYAYFVHESGPNAGQVLTDSSGNPLPAVPLYFTGVTQNGVDYWNSIDMGANPPVYHTDTIPSMPSGNVGVRIALSGNLTNDQCGQPLVTCYDTSGNTAPNGASPLYGIDNIRVFDASATPGTGSALAAMSVYGAKLTSANCTNPYFPTTGCSESLHVRVAFPAGIDPTHVTLQAQVDGQSNKQYAMARTSGNCPPANPAGAVCFESTTDNIPISASGWHTVDVVWSDTTTTDMLGAQACRTSGSNPCDDTNTAGTTAQRVFFADVTNAGPLTSVDILDNSSPTPILAEQPGSTAYHSYAQGDPATLGVQIGLQAAFATAAPNAAPVSLRNPGGGQSQAVDCNPAGGKYVNGYQLKYGNNFWNNTMTSLTGELEFGCVPTYQRWDGTTPCPGASGGALYPGMKNPLWDSDQPWSCAVASRGDINAAVGRALNGRILGNENANACPAFVGPNGIANGHNNWDPGGSSTWSPDLLPSDDHRIVFVYLAPFGTFIANGTNTYPFTRFATFYVTGWQSNGAQNQNPCQGNGDDTALPGQIVGHFMTYAAADTSADSTKHIHCTDPNGIDVCVAKLTQ
jgi:hypothetical protein